MVAKGLAVTDAMWPAIRIAYGWVHEAARILENADELAGCEVRRRLENLLAEVRAGQATVGTLQPAVAHFLKVSASYWPGLFHCYDVPGLPRTNNILEHFFGSVRSSRTILVRSTRRSRNPRSAAGGARSTSTGSARSCSSRRTRPRS